MTAIRRLSLLFALALAAPASAQSATARAPVAVPDSFLVKFETSRGNFYMMARTAWAPLGVARFQELVTAKYYDDVFFFRVVKGFVAQFGLSGDSAVNAAWSDKRIADDSVRHSNTQYTVSFARGAANTRTVQLFINLRDNARLDVDGGFGFPPIGEVVTGMAVVDSIYNGYGDSAPAGGRGRGGQPDTVRRGPQQGLIRNRGNAYLRADFPKLDYVKTARIVSAWKSGALVPVKK
jgi:peptidyl-prolyl cis-trans isomerase A (cyclophilin A)